MNESIAARRYAEAVFQLARDSGSFDTWRADLQTIAGVFGDPEVLGLLLNAKVPAERKEELLTSTLAGVGRQALNFARLVVQRRRVELAAQVSERYRVLVDEYQGVAHAEVTTVVEVSDEEKRMIADRLSQLTGKRVDVVVRIDPSIIGGMIARVGDKLIDGSTRTRLQALRRRLEAAR